MSTSRFPALGLIATMACVAALVAPAYAQSTTMCANPPITGYALVSPANAASAVPSDLTTIYLVYTSAPTAALPPIPQTRVLIADDSGAVTEGGVLRPTSRDGLPYALQPNDSQANDPANRYDAYSYTWVPALRAATHYTVMLARLDENNCVFARAGAFTTS